MSGLYSPDILRLALASADFPPLAAPQVQVERRAPLCGSRILLDLTCDAHGAVRSVGFALQACAVGQAAAALLARHAPGRNAADLAAALHALGRWLDDPAAPVPDIDGIAALSPVRALPARRGAALLAFDAAAAAAGQVKQPA